MGKFSENLMAGIVWDGIVLTLGTLAANTALQAASRIDAARVQGFRILKTEYFIDVVSMTDGEGPIIVGMQHNLSVAEVAEAILADPQGSKGIASPENEQAMRPVWPLGVVAVDIANQEKAHWKTVKIGWSIPEDSTLNWFAFNSDASALTTGGKIFIDAKHFGVWLKD